MLDIGCCLGKHQQNDLLDEQSQVERSDSIVSKIQSTSSMMSQLGNPDAELPTRRPLIKKIVEQLKDREVCKVVLHGKHGVGKTWIAKEVTKQVVREQIVDVTIWVYLNRKKLDPIALYTNMARQLSLQLDLASSEFHLSLQLDLAGAEHRIEDEDKRSSSFLIESLKQKLEGKKCLLVLDGGNPGLNEDNIVMPMSEQTPDSQAGQSLKKCMLVLNNIGGNLEVNEDNIVMLMLDEILDSVKLCKLLTTTCNHIIEKQTNGSKRVVPVEIRHLTQAEAKDLLQRTWEDDNNRFSSYDLEGIVERCNYLPAELVFTGNVLHYVLEHEPDAQNRELVVREAKKQGDDYWMLGCCSGNGKFINNITILRCLWLCKVYLEEHGSINYNELILNWILEGYIENTTSLKEAYSKGHNILMDLIDAGLLGEREAGDIVIETSGLNFVSYIFSVLCVDPGLDCACIIEKLNEGGNVKRMNGSIAAFKTSGLGSEREVNLVTLLVEGNDISKVDQMKIFGQSSVFERLQILCVSHMDPITNVFRTCRFLTVLILRDCNLLGHIDSIAALRKLKVLEISGRSSLEIIPAELFRNSEGLESLNLSGIPMISFPRNKNYSLEFVLKNLRSLILRGFTQIEKFTDLRSLRELQVLDVSRSKITFDKHNHFYIETLKILDLSDTDIYELPFFYNVKEFTHLLLRNCPLLNKLRPLKTWTKLQVIDASGSSNLRYFREMNLPSGDSLRKLDLSSTMIRKLPPLKNVSNLVHLCLKGCCELKELPPIEGAINLRFLDISDAIQLETINASFQEMKSLQELFLSNTKIKTLPPLSGLESLRKLALRGCALLQSLPKMEGLINLLLLDLWGCIALEPWSDDGQLSHVTILKS